jgi:hypothetical protein
MQADRVWRATFSLTIQCLELLPINFTVGYSPPLLLDYRCDRSIGGL